jgi:hypothetical protein
MHHRVCTLAPQLATLAPFMPVAPARCGCGQLLDLEMERDCGTCVDCQAEAAGLCHGSVQ